MRKLLLIILSLAAHITNLDPCLALDMRVTGNTVFLRGSIVSGDEFEFQSFIKDPAHASVKIIRLNSSGGKVTPARDMGRLIRSMNLTTYIDAKSDQCDSACTILFSAGVKRYYINAQNIKDGIYGFKELKVGLGYHEGNDPLSRDSNRYSGQATANVIAAYYEFDVKAAKDLITLAPPNKIYKLSAATALQLGIATHITNP